MSGVSDRASEKLEGICKHTGKSRGWRKRNLVLAAQQLCGAVNTLAPGFPANLGATFPEAPPTPDVSASRAGRRWEPIDVSGIDCSALRLCRQSDADFPVDRRAVVSAALLDRSAALQEERTASPASEPWCVGFRARAGLGQRSANWPGGEPRLQPILRGAGGRGAREPETTRGFGQ